eukprot:TRINITY_DN30533_c0_g2_i1.p1 TRINITY_DN30533_c0_g2~~TRINITY_DN30533_c0_g2_i1.p1  ORF type:complete len:695 (+),score=98.16 TRINITY_DN30533_c0_g2_i1:133-2217(+)
MFGLVVGMQHPLSLALVLIVVQLVRRGVSAALADGGVSLPAQSWVPPPFFDYDCDVASALPESVFDWNLLYKWVNETTQRNVGPSRFHVPEAVFPMLDEEKGDSLPATALAECPLGVLYFRVLRFYTAPLPGDVESRRSNINAEEVIELFRHFSVSSIALSRWPIFPALNFFVDHHEIHADLTCDGVVGLTDWGHLRRLSNRWAVARRQRHQDEQDQEEEDAYSIELEISDIFNTIFGRHQNHRVAASECPYGLYFLAASQVVAAANRVTQFMKPFNDIIDDMFRVGNFFAIASSGWPIFWLMHLFSDLNKQYWFFHGDRKYLRGFGDWNLRRDELSPLVPRSLEFLSTPWRAHVERIVDELVLLDPKAYTLRLMSEHSRKELAEGPMRPILRNLVDAALVVADKAKPDILRGNRRLCYVVLLYGGKWADILASLARRHRDLGLAHILFAVAIGEDASAACEGVVAAGFHIVCWSPNTASQVHRFTSIHALLHLGIDVIYMDMDTIMLRDPTPRILEQAEGYDALFATHATADCINIGVFFIRASGRTAIWFSQFVTWYHDHPFEIDQRGIHAFSGLPSMQMAVAHEPEDLVSIRSAALNDINEFVIHDVGWYGDLESILVSHWCHRPIEEKEVEIRKAYAAADVATAHGISLAAALAAAKEAQPGSPWFKIVEFRRILESYRVDKPFKRVACW